MNLEKRLQQHISGKGARYTKVNGAVKILYSENLKNHKLAAIREVEIKKLTRIEKKKLIKKR